MAKQAAELARSNSDLQQFSSIASHDLQEPLRNMAICSELLNRNYRNLLDENGRQLLDLISGRGQDKLSRRLCSPMPGRSGPETVPMLPVSTGDTLDQALTSVKSSIQESGAIVTHDELPIVMGDRIQLAQLFQHLENAIKYRRGVPPEIHVELREARRGLDDFSEGQRARRPGIALPADLRTLPAAEEFEDCRFRARTRYVQTYRRAPWRFIWVRSEQGQGSTFCSRFRRRRVHFQLPPHQFVMEPSGRK